MDRDDSDWQAHITTKPDGMTQEDLRRALAERLAAHKPAPPVAPSFDVTAEFPILTESES